MHHHHITFRKSHTRASGETENGHYEAGLWRRGWRPGLESLSGLTSLRLWEAEPPAPSPSRCSHLRSARSWHEKGESKSRHWYRTREEPGGSRRLCDGLAHTPLSQAPGRDAPCGWGEG